MNKDRELSASSSGLLRVNEEQAPLTNSFEKIFQETDIACQDLPHTSGAECNERPGPSLKERVKGLPIEERRILIKEAIEEQRYKEKYFENMKKKEEYDRKIEEARIQIEQLSKTVFTLRQENKERRNHYHATQKALRKNESELNEFKEEVKMKLKKKDKMKEISEEKAVLEKSILINSRKTLKCQQKLLHKAEQEKKLKENFSKNLNFLEGICKDLKNNDALPANKREEVESNIVDWKLQLALYEDSNLDEIKALHDGDKNIFNATEQKDNEKVLQKNEERNNNGKDSEEVSIVNGSTSSLSKDKNESDDLMEVH